MAEIKFLQNGREPAIMKNYNDLVLKVLFEGTPSKDRTGVGTVSLFGEQLRFDLTKGFPAVTTKRLAWRSVVAELIWFIEGSSDERRLSEIQHGTRDPNKKTIWTANAQAEYWLPKARYSGDLGRVYGVQWRNWLRRGDPALKPKPPIDQLQNLIEGLKKDPTSRRHIISAWNVGELDQMALPPCHAFVQFYLRDNRLSCQMYQRSADLFLGVPFNIASYALFTHLIAKEIGSEVGELIITFGDVHIYTNHIDAVHQQVSREPFPLPELDISSVKSIYSATVDDCQLINYQCHPTIKAKMAV
jgi:thymidylate synthase